MAATSLAEQLQKLSVPQTSIYKDDKKRASLLFDPKEAALKDRDTFYEIGVSGLKELIALNEGFRLFEDTLYSTASKDFERAVQTKEVNNSLDKTIEKFLLQLSPYFLLQSAHKALEWLVNRYQIHEYNQDAVVALILPYHETKIFIRFLQLLDIKSSSNRWNWLQLVQKNGIPLTKQVLHNQCVSNTATLQFICDTTLKYINEFGERATHLNTIFAFLCSTAIGTINTSNHVTESIITVLLPTIVEGIMSTVVDFRSAAYVILGFLVTKTTIKKKTLLEIIDTLLSTQFDLSHDAVLLINLIYTNQTHHRKMTESILNNFTASVMTTICMHLKKLVGHKISIQAFVMAFLSSILPLIQKDMEEFRKFCNLPEILFDEVDLREQQPEKIVRCVLNAFQSQKDNDCIEDNESDVEIIEEEDDGKILLWYSAFLRNVEIKYPEAFDKVVKHEISSDSKMTSKRRSKLSKVLGFKPAVSHKIGGTYLFENLNHVNPELRIEAVKYIAKEFQSLKSENIDFVKDSIVNRLNDDNLDVVLAALEIPNECLIEVLNEVDLTNAFTNIVSKGSKKWRTGIEKAVSKFCSFELLPVNQETIMASIPLLFPCDSQSAEVTWQIVTSPWGKKLGLLNNLADLNSSMIDNPEVLKQRIFTILFVDRLIDFNDKLDINLINKNNTFELFMYMLLKSCNFKQDTVKEITNILDTFFESIMASSMAIVSSAENTIFSAETVAEFIKFARKDKIIFEVMEHIFARIVEDMDVKSLPKPWCNICGTPETVLVKRLYELFITGCGIRTYASNYAKLLQKILDKFFRSAKEKFDFIANVAFGHILYASDPRDLVSPELQLRSLKLLSNFFAIQKKATWAYDSDVLMLTLLFNLNHPITPIRQCVIDLIVDILREEPDKKFIYIQLLRGLISHNEELLLDHEQLPQILKTVLTEQSPMNKLFRKNCLLRLTRILVTDTPAYIKSELVKLLAPMNSANTFTHVMPALNSLEESLKLNNDSKFMFDIYESNLMKYVYSLINENTVSTFAKDQIWNSIEIALKEYRECIVQEDQSLTCPCVLVMREIEENVFTKFPAERRKEFVLLVTSAGAFSNNPAISSAASKTMKRIHIKFEHFKPILDRMLNAVDPVSNVPKKKKTTMSMLSYQLAETDEWKLGVTLLEYVQSKKKMSVDNSFVNTLFQLLNKCLRFEEQSHVEYIKQLILSSLWYYCKKFIDDTDKEQLQALKSMFDVETVVQCIRGTQNPQTQHHALILLSHAAYMLPEQVLHHTMEIFTFMGSSVLRHDDAYSFQIITKIIETLIPILVKLDKDISDYTEKELQQLQKRVVPVLRIFADVVLHVPEHRRLPLYKKLIETLGASQFLWVFLALLLETHVAHFNENKKKDKVQQRTLADQELPINRLDFGQSILLEFEPEIILENFIKLMAYIKSLPLQKDDDEMDTVVDPGDIFSLNSHTAIQLRHYKYVIVTFMNTCLASSRFIQHSGQATDINTMENHYKTFIINILTYIQSISKITDEKTAKYWRVMLHHSYDLLDHTNNLLSAPMFLSVVRGLMKHTLQTVRRKSMELVNSKIQFSPEFFNDVDKELLFSLLPVLLDVVKTIETEDQSLNESAAQELELNQQSAMLSLKLLTRMLASENPEPFKPVLEAVTDYTCNHNICGNVMASIVLCLAELCANLKAHALSNLRRFMPALIKVLKKQRKADTPELVLQSTVTAISKIVESLPLFLSPYLQKILYEYSLLLAKWQNYDQELSKVSGIVTKLMHIKKKIAGSIPPRVLIPVVNDTHQMIIEKENYDAVGPVMSVLADSFANVTTADFTALQQDLTTFFMNALQLRSDAVEKKIDANVIDRAEDEVVNALVCLVLKLSETSFRPFYFKLYDWAIRTNVEGHKDRTITFYRLSSAIAEKLKGLFVLFAGHFIKNAAELLDACNASKTETLYFDSEEKCVTLITYILKTLHIVFLYDSQSFLNKDRFETLMQPVVDQLENTLGGIGALKARAAELAVPCAATLAVAVADDSLWKLLNYQILLKSRHNEPEIRLIALDCLVAMATQLGSNWLPLLAESVPFLAELLEDGDQKIEMATKDAIRKLEHILGEPLEKYF